MALISPGPAAAAISGKIGGIIFAVSKTGRYMRRAAARCDPSTTPQLQHRAQLPAAYESWRALTDADRLAWNRAAESYPIANRLHLPRTISGWSLYASLFIPSGADFLQPLTSPPLMSIAPAPYAIAATISLAAGFSIAWSPSTNQAKYQVTLAASRTLSNSPQAQPRSWRYLGAISPAPSPWDFESIFTTTLGTPQVDETVHLQLRIWELNRIPSPPSQLAVTVTA